MSPGSPNQALAKPPRGCSARGSGVEAEPTLDGTGSVRIDVAAIGQLEPVAAASCWRAWNAATLGYLAGVAAR
ncbi:MAG TPA: hypothetical protein VIT46_01685, partial [Gaiellaceae bacterium]